MLKKLEDVITFGFAIVALFIMIVATTFPDLFWFLVKLHFIWKYW